jgi:hypothetical protein
MEKDFKDLIWKIMITPVNTFEREAITELAKQLFEKYAYNESTFDHDSAIKKLNNSIAHQSNGENHVDIIYNMVGKMFTEENSVKNVDDSFGALNLQYLPKNKENCTIILFINDNGYHITRVEYNSENFSIYEYCIKKKEIYDGETKVSLESLKDRLMELRTNFYKV